MSIEALEKDFNIISKKIQGAKKLEDRLDDLVKNRRNKDYLPSPEIEEIRQLIKSLKTSEAESRLTQLEQNVNWRIETDGKFQNFICDKRNKKHATESEIKTIQEEIKKLDKSSAETHLKKLEDVVNWRTETESEIQRIEKEGIVRRIGAENEISRARNLMTKDFTRDLAVEAILDAIRHRIDDYPLILRLLDEGRDWTEKAKTIYDKKSYKEAVEIYQQALTKFTEALSMAEKNSDTEMLPVAKTNTAKTRRNICNCLIQQSLAISEDAGKLFEHEDFNKSRETYQESVKHLESAEKIAHEDTLQKEFEQIKNLKAVLDKNIAECQYGLIKKEIDSFYNRGTQLREDAQKIKDAGQKLMSLKEARELFEKAYEIAAKHNDKFPGTPKNIQYLQEQIAQDIINAQGELSKVSEVEMEGQSIIKEVGAKAPTIPTPKMTGREDGSHVEVSIEEGVQPFHICAGAKFDNLTLVRQLGKGGFGEVWLAQHPSFEKVAVKFLKFSSASAKERFKSEAKIQHECNHQNIVTIHEVKLESPPYYAWMPYVEGESLGEKLRKSKDKKIQLQEAIPIMKQTLRALKYAYDEQRICHGDIKPENILIEAKSNHAKVTDFGLAAEVSDHLRLSLDTKGGGTRGYLAPEQHMGVTPQTDVYNLGIMFYELLTGRISPNRPCPPVKGVPQDISDIITRATQEDPQARYQNAAEMLEALEQIKL